MTVEGVLQTVSLVSKLTKNPQIFGEGGEGRSGYGVLIRDENGMERVSSTKVKLKRAQGECLGIRSR